MLPDVERVSAEIGYWLAEPFWGRGIATEALIAVTRYAIDTHKLTRIYALPFAWNAPSCRVLEKAGYVLEARLRRSAIKDGVIIDSLDSADARLVIIPRKKDKDPKVWAIHTLHMTNLGANQSMPYDAVLTNAVPPGEIKTSGHFGPWQTDEPGNTPLGGTFAFDKANLAVFKGIGGTLSSRGSFGGSLNWIDVNGETDTPDFVINVGDRVFFESDQTDLTPQARATLDKQAQWLGRYNRYTFTIEGHADERGTREYNIALGARRAQTVREYLVSRGIDANRMRTISYGKERPVAVCNDISCWSQNRRAVTVLNASS